MEPQPSDVAEPLSSDRGAHPPRRASTRLDAAARQLDDLADRWAGQAPPTSNDDAAADDAAAQLRVVVQELRTAHEQLRRQAAELADARALVEAERERYRELFQVAREGYVVVDLNGHIRELNRAAAALLNLPPDYLIGKPIATYVDFDDRREFRTRLYRARVGTPDQEWTSKFAHRDLGAVKFLVAASPVMSASGTPESVRLLLRDVSASREALVASREPAAILRGALDTLSAHVAVVDVEGRIVTVNRAWQHAAAPGGLLSAGAAAGDNYLDLCGEAAAADASAADVRREVTAVLQGARERGEAVYSVRRSPDSARGETGALQWYALRVTRCAGPEPLHVVVTHEDITADYEAHLRERELLEERAARAAAEAANKAKSEFLATLSHELRTPLNAIAGYAQLLEMGVRGPVTLEQAEDLRRILRSERHLLGLINELLNFSRLERGDVAIECGPVSLPPLVREVLELVEPQASAQGLALFNDCALDNVAAWGDAEKIRQILVNLLSNALKFTGAGSVRIECDADEVYSYLRVHDTGVGIPMTMLDEIFDPFVQAHRDFRGASDGIGLGLAISRNLARAMHGELTVTSEVGHGSSFELRLPRAAASADVP